MDATAPAHDHQRMAAVSTRLARRVRADFGWHAVDVLGQLAAIPESLPLGGSQDAERLQAALVLPARGDVERFADQLSLARIDWRDALVGAGLADTGWAQRLDRELGRR